MKTLNEFRPTPLDPKGKGPSDRGEWLVLCTSRSRDSEALDESNFEKALEMLGGECGDVEIHMFNHWAAGWFEIIAVRPGSDAEEKAREIEASIADYPVLDEEDFSRREWEVFVENWNDWAADEFVKAVVAKADLTGAEEEAFRSLLESDEGKEKLRDFYDGYAGTTHSAGVPDVRSNVESHSYEDEVSDFISRNASSGRKP